MTNQEILEKAIKKAIDGGWKTKLQGVNYRIGNDFYPLPLEIASGESDPHLYSDCHLEIIFSHNFAKALWGEELYCRDCRDIIGDKDEGPAKHDVVPLWQHCLQQMVIADDTIKYLGENI